MVSIRFIQLDGNVTEVEGKVGASLMQAAVNNGVAGIVAECGGGCACATCHIHVEPDWMDQVGAPNEHEEDMLTLADGVDESSRLSCQVILDEKLDGLVVRVAQQHP